MAQGGVRWPAALGLALRLLFGFGLGLQAAPTPVPTQSLAQAPGSCSPTSFQCRTSGFCVPRTLRCDGDKDCPDGSDEEDCRIKPCAQDGECWPPTGSPCPCDNIADCPDGIVENSHNCSSQSCPAGELRCLLGGACVPHTWLCDGHPDCPDSSDELGCGMSQPPPLGTRTPSSLETGVLVGLSQLRWCSVPVWPPSPCSCCPGSVPGGACTRWGCWWS
ncbi:CD320 antigen isoform X3 [Enhydra lutris kenyoni]|uniref:CD320 antigen isoform X3 n=1 Tax=Enhydra lutris kenyoni TaxID=391180 RepID=A0A2Y9L5H4_ENHLU|nr:CD320 antigen isoform X3 [Enhydra lutris kenyoni]